VTAFNVKRDCPPGLHPERRTFFRGFTPYLHLAFLEPRLPVAAKSAL